jgi:aromatic ring-opening dioxygenase catalytic subunit (LigB family)
MRRREFLGMLAALPLAAKTMKTEDPAKEAKGRDDSDKLPVLFIGHGSPMNGIEKNHFSESWIRLGKELPKPKAILCVSAHWLTRGTAVTAMPKPPTIHDFGGFPKELFAVQYPAPGSPEGAKEIQGIHPPANISLDQDWGLKKHIASGNHAPLIDWENLGKAARLAIPTPDHYYPLLYVLGMAEKGEAPVFFNDEAAGGSLTMTSVRFG